MMRQIFFTFLCSLIVFNCSTENNDDLNPEPTIQLPNVTLDEFSDLSNSSVTLKASILDDGGASISSRGFCYNTSPNPTIANNKVDVGSGIGSFSAVVNDLVPNTSYYVRSYAINLEGTAYSNEINIQTTSSCEGIYEGNVILNNQSDVDEFGSKNYCGINGSLIIDPSPSIPDSVITDLSPLFSIKFVDGLSIFNIKEIESLNNLNLEEVKYTITIANCSFSNFDALRSIQSINGVELSRNDKMTNLDFLEKLNPNLIRLHIESNENLEDLSGISNVTGIENNFVIKGNQNLKSIEGFNELMYVGENFRIENNNSLSELKGFNSINRVGNELTIMQNHQISIDGFNELVEIGNRLILNIHELTSFNSFKKIKKTGGFDLASVIPAGSTAFMQLEEVNELFKLRSNNINLSKFANLKIVRGNVFIELISDVNINGFRNLSTIEGDVVLRENYYLTSIDGIEGINIMGDLVLWNNPLLSDFCALQDSLINGTVSRENLEIGFNLYNPTAQDIIDGNCSI